MGGDVAADMRIYNLQILHYKVTTLNARMLWMSSSNSIKHVQVLPYLTF